MGTEVQFKSFFPRYYSGKDINEDSNGCNWPLYYTDQSSPNGHLSSSFQWVTAATAVDASLDYEKFALKRKMLEHEAVFKKQVYELHRLYKIQRDLMDEIKRKEPTPYHAFGASNTLQASPFNGFSRPSKIGKEKIDLQQPAVVYIDLEESGENEVKDGFDLNQPAQMDDTASSEFVHPRSNSFLSMAQAHQGSSNRGRNDSLGFKEKLCVPSQPKHNLPSKQTIEIRHLSNDHQFLADHTRLLSTCGAESSKLWDSGLASHGSKHQFTASYDREKSSFWLFENHSILSKTGAEKTEQTGSPKPSKNAAIDINLPCEDLVTEEAPSTKRSTLFDLNSCIDEDDTYDAVAVDGRPMGVEIDLEAPAFADTEEGNVCLEELAAEAIVAMSSSTVVEAENVLLSPDNLNWFVDIALSDQKVKEKTKMDYFESMTLKLAEMDEEEHLPKGFEAEDDEVGPAPTNTGRGRAQRRRGRQQKKDFQRDILPGLTTLSRQEVAEDLQAFGGLMRATGHVWGPSTRKGSSRGRRKTVAQPAAVEPVVVDVARLEEGSLISWGKTRRPRQQRCPSGNFRSTSMSGSSSLLAGCL